MPDVYVAIIVIGIIIFIIGFAFLIQGAPYVVSDDETTAKMASLVDQYSPRRVLELGSGNGKLVVSIAKLGIEVDGIELNPILVVLSKRAIRKAGVQNKANIIWGSFWHYDFSSYNLVTMYAVTHIMPRLETKFSSELKPNSIVISNYFKFPNKKTQKVIGKINIYTF